MDLINDGIHIGLRDVVSWRYQYEVSPYPIDRSSGRQDRDVVAGLEAFLMDAPGDPYGGVEGFFGLLVFHEFNL